MYYFANDEYVDSIYGSVEPICIDYAEVEFLACGWGITTEELMELMHEASPKEIAQYGVYSCVYT